MKNSVLQIVNVYNPNGNTPSSQFEKYIQQLSTNFVMTGDFNAHHPLWSMPNTAANVSGNALIKILQKCNNICLCSPQGMQTYIHSSTGTLSVLDLAFSSPNISSDITLLQGPCMGSDS